MESCQMKQAVELDWCVRAIESNNHILEIYGTFLRRMLLFWDLENFRIKADILYTCSNTRKLLIILDEK